MGRARARAAIWEEAGGAVGPGPEVRCSRLGGVDGGTDAVEVGELAFSLVGEGLDWGEGAGVCRGGPGAEAAAELAGEEEEGEEATEGGEGSY